ncbi:MAG: hypothetical protein ABL889_02060 [Terricaulis sp.]
MNFRALGLSAAMSLSVLALSACGDTMEQRAASGALIGAGAGAAVGAATTPERRCIERNRRGNCVRWD